MTAKRIVGSSSAFWPSVTRCIVLATALTGCGETTEATDTDDGGPTTLTVEPDPSYLTMMNTWTPTDETTVTEVASAVSTGLQNDIRARDGFLGAAVLESLDGSNVVVYGRWRDQAALEATGAAIEAGEAPDFAAAIALATYLSVPYRLDSVIDPLVVDISADVTTMINTWAPKGGATVDDVAAALSAGIGADAVTQPGFRAGGVFASLDQSNVRVMAHWDSVDSVGAFGEVIAQGGAPTFAMALGVADSDPHPYRVRAVILP